MEQLTLTLEELNQEEQEIRNNLGGIVKNFVRTGWSLSRIDRYGAYRLKGFRSITDYARETFGMSPDGVSRFIRVYEKYSLPGDTPELREEYREYNFSQLVEMLQIPESDYAMIRPETKREDIRELARFNKENENNPDRLLNWQQDSDEILKEAVEEFFRPRKSDLNQIYEKYGPSPYTEDEIKEMAMFLYHEKPKRFRSEKVFIILYPDQIFVKGSDGEPRDITWSEFFEIMGSVFDGDDREDTWRNHFEPEEIPGQDNILNHPEYLPGKLHGRRFEHCIYHPEEECISEDCSGCRMKKKIAPAQKTEEQKYNEEQSKIDRETRRKLEEMEDKERMEHLPSDEEQKILQIRMASKYYDDVAAGIMSFWFAKGTFRTGEFLNMLEFSEGRHTGRMLKMEITYILDDYTGMEDGYCILAIKPVKDEKEQPPLPKLKNNDERKEWLKNYKTWPLIHTDAYTGAKYYKYHFDNGAVLVAEVWEKHGDRYLGDYETSYMHLIGGPEPPKGQYGQGKWERHETFSRYPDSETSLVEFLKEVQKA